MANSATHRSPLMQAIALDQAIPIHEDAVRLWLKDVENPMRWVVRPLLQFVFAILLHLTWFFKRLPLPQFSAHKTLQKTICWFCRNFVSPEANQLILRHYATESNILNFLIDNTPGAEIEPIELYPQDIGGMITASFVDHDQELFRIMREIGEADPGQDTAAPARLNWTHWRDVEVTDQIEKKRWTQFLDFETSHALFMCLFCMLLTAEEYRDAINGFNLDQSIAIRVGKIVGDMSIVEMAYNKYPLYFVGPWNLGQRFLMHGFFTEYLHAFLEKKRAEEAEQAAA